MHHGQLLEALLFLLDLPLQFIGPALRQLTSLSFLLLCVAPATAESLLRIDLGRELLKADKE